MTCPKGCNSEVAHAEIESRSGSAEMHSTHHSLLPPLVRLQGFPLGEALQGVLWYVSPCPRLLGLIHLAGVNILPLEYFPA